jgi:hypothetical protein
MIYQRNVPRFWELGLQSPDISSVIVRPEGERIAKRTMQKVCLWAFTKSTQCHHRFMTQTG